MALFLIFGTVLIIEGTCPTKRDAWKINFWVVHVVAQVAAHAPCRPILAGGIMALTW